MPILTVLDEEAGLLEEDQRALVRHVVQQGSGADIVFSAGTTGEWDKIDNDTRQDVIRVCAEEVAKLNVGPRAYEGASGVEHWAGVTAPRMIIISGTQTKPIPRPDINPVQASWK